MRVYVRSFVFCCFGNRLVFLAISNCRCRCGNGPASYPRSCYDGTSYDGCSADDTSLQVTLDRPNRHMCATIVFITHLPVSCLSVCVSVCLSVCYRSAANYILWAKTSVYSPNSSGLQHATTASISPQWLASMQQQHQPSQQQQQQQQQLLQLQQQQLLRPGQPVVLCLRTDRQRTW